MNLSKKKLQELKDKKISIEDLNNHYFIKFIGNAKVENIENISKLLNENICSFQKIVDKFKSIKDSNSNSRLAILLENMGFFKELFENEKLSTDDLRYLLNRIDNKSELYRLCDNTSLIKRILNEFILDKETAERFSPILENIDWWCKDHNIHTIFDLIEYENKNNEEILDLNELNKKVYLLTNFDLTEYQRLELIEILRNNEQAQNTLIQIIDNNLEDQYDFEKLKSLLNKDSEKKKLKLNL